MNFTVMEDIVLHFFQHKFHNSWFEALGRQWCMSELKWVPRSCFFQETSVASQ